MQENNNFQEFNNQENSLINDDTEQNVTDVYENHQENYNGQGNRDNSEPLVKQYVPIFVPLNTETPEEKEKKAIKKTAMLIGLSCLIMTGITYFWGTAYFALMKAFGIDISEAYKIANDPFVLQFLQIMISTIMFIPSFMVVFKIGGYSISRIVSFLKPEKGTVIPIILIGAGFCSFANVSVYIAGSVFSSLGIEYSVDRAEDPNGILGFIISFIATAIVPALVEEFACRGIILGSLRKFGDGFAIIVSSVIFGLIHGNFEQIPFAFLIGLILGFVTVKTGSIWLACAIHSLNNAVSVIFGYLSQLADSNIQGLVYNIYSALSLIVGIIGIYLLAKRKEDTFKLSGAQTQASEAKKHKWFFTQPVIIILTVICLIESISYFF